MVDAGLLFNAFIASVAVVTAVLMVRNIRSTREVTLPIVARRGDGGELTTYVDGRRLVGVAYVAEGLPREGDDLPLRLARLARSARLSVTFVSSMFSVRKSSLLRMLEEEIRRAEFSYTATRHVKYRERLSFLEGLYKEVARSQVPYLGGFGLIVWVDPGDKDSMLSAEAFRDLVEAEADVKLRRVRGSSLEEILTSSRPTWMTGEEWGPVTVNRDIVNDETGVVIGEDVDSLGSLVIARWPDAFRAHVGVFGPTGRGKTVLLSGLAAQLASLSHTLSDPLGVIVIDPKGDLSDLLRGVSDRYVTPLEGSCVPILRADGLAAKLIESARETGYLADVPTCVGSRASGPGLTVYDLRGLPNEARNVYGSLLIASLALEASEGTLEGKFVVIIDEAWRFVRGSALHLEFAMREGRSKGLYIVYASQIPSDVGGAVVENTGVKVVFGGFTTAYTEMAAQLGIDDAKRLASLPVGHALVRDEQGRTKHVKVLDFGKLLKTLPPLGLGEGVRSNGQELKAAEGGQGLVDVQEPGPHPPGAGEVPPDRRQDPGGRG